MKQTSIRLGPFALLFVVMTICLAVFAMLAISTAESDRRMAERYAQTVTETYERESQGQSWLSEADAAIQNGSDLQDIADTAASNTAEKQITAGNGSLQIGLRWDGQKNWQITSWKTETNWTPATNFGKLWAGNGGKDS